jgi:hypothetical protein
MKYWTAIGLSSSRTIKCSAVNIHICNWPGSRTTSFLLSSPWPMSIIWILTLYSLMVTIYLYTVPSLQDLCFFWWQENLGLYFLWFLKQTGIPLCCTMENGILNCSVFFKDVILCYMPSKYSPSKMLLQKNPVPTSAIYFLAVYLAHR